MVSDLEEKTNKEDPGAFVEHLSNDFKAVGHPLRLAILFILYGSEILYGEKCLTYSQIQDVLGFPNIKRITNTLDHHIDILIKNEFIEKIPHQEKEGKSRVITLYRVKTKGRDFLKVFGIDKKIEDFMRGKRKA